MIMVIKQNIKLGLSSLMSTKQRSILALIGIVIGIGSVIAMISMGIIVQNEALRQFKEMGTDILTVSKDHDPKRRANQTGFTLGDIAELKADCPDIGALAPYTTIHEDISFRGARESVPAIGATESFKDIFKLSMTEGRFISDLDLNMPYCVIGDHVAEFMQQQGIVDPVGRELRYAGRFFTVIGVVEKVDEGGIRPHAINEGIIIPLATTMRMPNRPDMPTITVRIARAGSCDAAREQLEHYFHERTPNLKLRITSAEELIRNMQKQMNMFTLLLGAIGSISLVVGGVGVMNVMLVSVSERKVEIGTRRALGAQRGDIQSQFLIESLVLSLVGGFVGICLGVGASYVFCHFSNWEFVLSGMAVALGVGVSAAVGIFFGYYPARKAARLNPIDALRGL